ncbi:MAG: IS110 family transposase [Acidimicrobiales bacterium]
MPLEANPVAIGIDAAVVANHHVVICRRGMRGTGEAVEDFVVAPTLAGMEILTKRMSRSPGVMAVAEPTSMTWLPLSVALRNAGADLALIGNRHSARLRSGLAGKNKSDPIDAAVLSRAVELFALQPARIPSPSELALRRAAQRRGKTLLEVNRCLRRVTSQARWAFPDVWNAFAGSRPTALAVLNCWPYLESLARARTSSITESSPSTPEVSLMSKHGPNGSAQLLGTGQSSGRAISTSTLSPGRRASSSRTSVSPRRDSNVRANKRAAAGSTCGATTGCCCRCPAWA